MKEIRMINPNIKCENCVFFQGNKDRHGEIGVCMRYPPSVFPNPTRTVANGPFHINSILMRPQVRDTEFCGEFSLAEPISAPAPAPLKPTPA
jgi:hypothetical protein